MDTIENKYNFFNSNVSLLELSYDEDLKVNIINKNSSLVNYYKNKLKNKEIQKVKYFDIDITEDVNEINGAFSSPLKICEENEDNLQLKINRFLLSCNDYTYARKILLNDIHITIHHGSNDTN
ncbi:conserved Plasmodium membrane protein, unknown function [Plasmodium gallinaceum]|uniref:Uncharacterized protein n=1 Tax=Plasmodium gallinaceum TaxID=5849 RepID=A0A1J1GLD2_PLAGA|nr:conserved Plasmodium membrane protein, unknown function [Plasmodium gallinaceum]CRG93013.1 conserved Plasmodium membrane protein, unknown function [Plasmodium gallinaceum]